MPKKWESARGPAPPSFIEAIEQEAGRFASYLDTDKIKSQESMIEEFEKKFDTDRGQHFLKHFSKRKKAIQALWDTETVQDALFKNAPEQVGTEIATEEIEKVVEKDLKEVEIYQKEIDKELEDLKVQQTQTKEGVKYKRSFQPWTERQEQWIKSRKHYRSNVKLAGEFNKFFKRVKRSTSSISTKKLRIRKT